MEKILEKSGKSQGILSVRKSGNPDINDLISPHKEDGKYQGQKRFWSYIKSLKQDYSGVSSLKLVQWKTSD